MVVKRASVESSVLASVLYLPAQRRLEVEFRSGLCYQYFDVPPKCYEDLLRTDSKGTFFNTRIRNHFSSSLLESRIAAATKAS